MCSACLNVANVEQVCSVYCMMLMFRCVQGGIDIAQLRSQAGIDGDRLFARLDRNGDGVVDREELRYL